MVRLPTNLTAASRAQWLAELSQTLKDAQRLLCDLARTDAAKGDILELSARLEIALAETRVLQFGSLTEEPRDLQPKWSNLLPWDRYVEDYQSSTDLSSG